MDEISMKDMVNICKQYGFIYQGSEIYGGLANTWDYGPLGSLMKDNIKASWKKRFIQERDNAYELDSAILMHPRVWEASGHVASFTDPLIDCKNCKTRHRADNLIEEFSSDVDADAMNDEEMMEYIKKNKVPCPKCGKCDFTSLREFNLMFQTSRGVTSEKQSTIYLRPENAQGEYVNYLNVKRTTRSNLPFSIGQVGKAFRNEITPGNFTFRTIEFEQMEYQTFCKQGTDHEIYEYFKDYAKKYFMDLGIPEKMMRFHPHEKLAHYAKEACDIDYKFPFGFGEINGTHNRTDFDLKRHEEYSGEKMEFIESETNEKFVPYIIESTVGADRLFLALLFNGYHVQQMDNGEIREYMMFHPFIAPYKMAVLPLVKKYHSEKAKELYRRLRKEFACDYDESGSIGKRYRREDMMGTPYCITVDDETIENDTVTIRNIETMEQVKVKVGEIENFILPKIRF